MAAEDIGGIWNVKQPGYEDKADIQAALKLFLYGDYNFDTTASSELQKQDLENNSGIARHLQDLSDRITDQEELGIGSDYLTLAQIGALTGVADGYIAMASDSNGGAVESLYASAFYTNEAPTTDIVDGVLWVDKDSDALDTYVYNETDDEWVRINDLKNIIAAKGDLLVGTAADGLDNLTVGANGTVLTADDTQALGVKWQAPSVYSQPTLGTTAIASGATVTNVNDLTINSTTIPTSKTLVATDSTAYVVPPMSGNAGKYLTNDGSTPSWATVSGGGKVLQVVSGSTTSETTIASTTLTDSTLSATITPSSASSKILILVSQCIAFSRLTISAGGGIRLLRGSTSIYDPSNNALRIFADPGITTILSSGLYSIIYLDSPATTSATTYKTQLKAAQSTSSGEIVGQPQSNPSTMILMEIGA